jgi:hypothetical protein
LPKGAVSCPCRIRQSIQISLKYTTRSTSPSRKSHGICQNWSRQSQVSNWFPGIQWSNSNQKQLCSISSNFAVTTQLWLCPRNSPPSPTPSKLFNYRSNAELQRLALFHEGRNTFYLLIRHYICRHRTRLQSKLKYPTKPRS